ncbi:MAG: hypothetical protein LBV12_05120 [Puniceicoccales bacterium]|nr:hypothetical protein [Puniceicoccales bacterium]
MFNLHQLWKEGVFAGTPAEYVNTPTGLCSADNRGKLLVSPAPALHNEGD